MWHCQRRSRDDRGAVAVEFALLLPFILVLLAGMFDFALAFNAQIQLSQAAQAGARALALDPNGPVVARAQGASPSLQLAAGDVATTACDGSTASVVVSYTFTMPLPIPGIDSTIEMKQKAVTPCTGP